jgi:ATP diphosphatase
VKDRQASLLDGVPPGLTELTCAVELQRRAARVGFDWDQLAPVLAKIREELAELEMEIDGFGQPGRKQDELGDLLFAVANLARKLDIDPEQALRGTNRKFRRRFNLVEIELAKRGKRPENASLEEMDAIWEWAKGHES